MTLDDLNSAIANGAAKMEDPQTSHAASAPASPAPASNDLSAYEPLLQFIPFLFDLRDGTPEGGSGAVAKLLAGDGIILDPSSGTGNVKITATSATTLPIARISTATAVFSGATSFSLEHDVSTSPPGAKVFIIGIEGHLVSSDIITSITHNGTPLTRLAAMINVGGESLWCYYLLDPSGSGGLANLVVTTSSDPGAGGGALYFTSTLYGNVSQAGFPEAWTFNSITSATALGYDGILASGHPYEWGVTINGSDQVSLALQAAMGNGAISSVFASNTRCLIADTNGSINPKTHLSGGIQTGSSGVLMFIQLFLQGAPA